METNKRHIVIWHSQLERNTQSNLRTTWQLFCFAINETVVYMKLQSYLFVCISLFYLHQNYGKYITITLVA